MAWLNAQALVVTATEAGSKLLQVPLQGEVTVIWKDPAQDGLSAAAPPALPGGQIAFVRQRLPGQESWHAASYGAATQAGCGGLVDRAPTEGDCQHRHQAGTGAPARWRRCRGSCRLM